MENMKKSIIIFGAVLIALMMTSSATATLQHIDSNIKVKEKHLKMLQEAYNSEDITNQDFKTLIKGIIDLLTDPQNPKKIVTRADIEKIIEDNDLAVSGVYGGKSISGTSPGTCGPHFIRFYWGMFMFWNARQSDNHHNPISVTVGPDTYTSDHQGLALSYFGFALHSWGFDMSHGALCDFGLGGVGFLIFVS